MEGEKASSGQLKMIFGLAKKSGIDNDTLHDVAARICRKDSLAQLTVREASSLITYLKRAAGDGEEPTGRATKAQQGKIYAIARSMGWAEDPKRLRGFLETQAKVSDVRFLSPQQAGVIIEALKAIQQGGRSERRRADG